MAGFSGEEGIRIETDVNVVVTLCAHYITAGGMHVGQTEWYPGDGRNSDEREGNTCMSVTALGTCSSFALTRLPIYQQW